MKQLDFIFLTEQQIWGKKQLDIFKKYGTKCAITDFSIFLGGYASHDYTSKGIPSKDLFGEWWTRTWHDYREDKFYDLKIKKDDRVVGQSLRMMGLPPIDGYIFSTDGDHGFCSGFIHSIGARPAVTYSSLARYSYNKVRNENGILEVESGEYPQTVVSLEFSLVLEKIYQEGKLIETDKRYTTNLGEHIEYEYNGKKYIRLVGDSYCISRFLSDGRKIEEGKVYWVEVEPIKWLVDEKANIAQSKKILFAGVPFVIPECSCPFNFNETNIKKFMDDHFSKDIQIERSKMYYNMINDKYIDKNTRIVRCLSIIADLAYGIRSKTNDLEKREKVI